MTEADPVLRSWYRPLDKGQEFRVVALNEDEDSVEIQYFDGTVEEIGLDEWYQLDIEPVEPPENWSGPVDVAEMDDLGTQITDTTADDWEAPAQEIPPRPDRLKLDDDWGEGRPREEPWEGEL